MLKRADEDMIVTTRVVADGSMYLTPPIEDFGGTINEVLRLGWSGHLAAGQSVLVALRETEHLSVGERTVCRALLALFGTASEDVASARRFARQAITDSARPFSSARADELRWLRLARALAVNVCNLIGDRVRAGRAAQARFMAGDPESRWLIRAGADHDWEDAPEPVQRFARFLIVVNQRFAARPKRGLLTDSELRILRHIDAGANAPEVARLLTLSQHTVRTHLRNAHKKLGARGRADALARARVLGLLDGPAVRHARSCSCV
jgi:DNA-binding CsgD family transcriptional regulator